MSSTNPLAELAPYLEAMRESDDSVSPPDNLTARLIATRSIPVPQEKLPREFGPYTLESILGHGSTGTVYQGYDRELDRHIAIKILAPEIAALPDARERFLREGRAAASLRHENLMTLFTVHQDTPTPCLTSPLLNGETLQQKLDREGPLPADEVITIARQIASALQHAHASDVLHRDIKPSNIFYETKAKRAILMDFGLARSLQTPSDLTLSGTIAGTPEYLAPEQIDDNPDLTPATDFYSLGATLYALASGKPPFSGKSLTSLLKKVALDQPASLENIPAWLNKIILALLSKKPDERPSSAHTLLNLLEQKKVSPSPGKLFRPLATIAALAIIALIIWAIFSEPGKTVTGEPPFSLTDALSSPQAEVIIPNSGVHNLAPFSLTRDLTLTAAKPGTILTFSELKTPITTTRNLTLKNLTIRLKQDADESVTSLIETSGSSLQLINCRIEISGRDNLLLLQSPIISATSTLDLGITNTAVFSFRSPLCQADSGSTVQAQNSLLITPALLIANSADHQTVELDHTTAVCLNLVVAKPGRKPNQVTAKHCYLEVNHAFLWSPSTEDTPISRVFSWQGNDNTLATTSAWFSTHPSQRQSRRNPNTYRDWQLEWQTHDSSEAVAPAFIPRDLAATYSHPSEIELATFEVSHPTGPDLSKVGP